MGVATQRIVLCDTLRRRMLIVEHAAVCSTAVSSAERMTTSRSTARDESIASKHGFMS
jgi:hypothetical protein